MAEQHELLIAVAARGYHRAGAVEVRGLPAEARQAVGEHPRRVFLVAGRAWYGDDIHEKSD